MWDIPKLYIMACSGSVSLVPFQPIAISILFHHYKELMECKREVEEIMMTTADGKVVSNNNNHHSSNNIIMTEQEKSLETYAEMVEEMEAEIVIPTTLDGFLIKDDD